MSVRYSRIQTRGSMDRRGGGEMAVTAGGDGSHDPNAGSTQRNQGKNKQQGPSTSHRHNLSLSS